MYSTRTYTLFSQGKNTIFATEYGSVEVSLYKAIAVWHPLQGLES